MRHPEVTCTNTQKTHPKTGRNKVQKLLPKSHEKQHMPSSRQNECTAQKMHSLHKKGEKRKDPPHMAANLIKMTGGEDIFVISYTGKENTGRRPTPVCTVKIEANPVRALIYRGASVNVIDAVMLKKLATRLKSTYMEARHPCPC